MSRTTDYVLSLEEQGYDYNERQPVMPDYEEWLSKQEMTEEDINKMGEEYEHNTRTERAF